MYDLNTIDDYYNLIDWLDNLDDEQKIIVIRHLARTKLFFLIWYVFARKDIEHQWLLDRCNEIEASPNGHIDLWARDHYKSTIITFAKTIQDILASHGDDPLPEWGGVEPTFGIFSHTRPIAKGFLRQIKRELEGNGLLKVLFPDVIWVNPSAEAPKWSEDDGLVLKRKSNPKESTIEAWGLVEGQPISKHFNVLIYDDVVTQDSVYTPDSLRKTLLAWELSTNLGSSNPKCRYIGTRYHFNDTYREIMARGSAKPRIYPATDDGTPNGNPVLKSKEEIERKWRDMGPYTFATQLLQNPLADEIQGFKKEWISYYDQISHETLNRYLIVDPASEKKKSSDYTAMFVIGLGEDENYYVLDIVRDRLNLKERADEVFRLHRRWRPLAVGYEKYGMQADVEYIKEKQARENYRFSIIELGGQIPKNDRIKRLIPSLATNRWFFPNSIMKTDYQGRLTNLIETYINEEFLAFPVPVHDDLLDCQARIVDPELNAIFPKVENDGDRYARYDRQRSYSAWAS